MVEGEERREEREGELAGGYRVGWEHEERGSEGREGYGAGGQVMIMWKEAERT